MSLLVFGLTNFDRKFIYIFLCYHSSLDKKECSQMLLMKMIFIGYLGNVTLGKHFYL